MASCPTCGEDVTGPLEGQHYIDNPEHEKPAPEGAEGTGEGAEKKDPMADMDAGTEEQM